MKKYESPSVHVIEHVGPLDNAQIAALSDSELEAYLKENGYRRWIMRRLLRSATASWRPI